MQSSTRNEVTLEVSRLATKNQIKNLIEKIHGVNVIGVRTMKISGNRKRVGKRRTEMKENDMKKAIIRLKEGQKIEVFDSKS